MQPSRAFWTLGHPKRSSRYQTTSTLDSLLYSQCITRNWLLKPINIFISHHKWTRTGSRTRKDSIININLEPGKTTTKNCKLSSNQAEHSVQTSRAPPMRVTCTTC